MLSPPWRPQRIDRNLECKAPDSAYPPVKRNGNGAGWR